MVCSLALEKVFRKRGRKKSDFSRGKLENIHKQIQVDQEDMGKASLVFEKKF
jgi:hypothetical protein